MLVTNDASRDARVQKEAESAVSAGAEVIVVGVGTAEQAWIPSGYELRLVEPMHASATPVRSVRIVQNLTRERAVERRMVRAARATAADIIHCNDLDTLWSGARAAAGRARVVYDAHELSTEGGVAKPWQRWLMTRRENRLAHRADAVIAVNRPIAEWLVEHRGLSRVPTVVMNGARGCSAGSTVASGPVRMLFQGQFFFDRNIEAAVRCMPRLRGNATLTLQGWGEAELSLRALVAELGLEDCVEFIPPCGPLEVVESARGYDCGLILHKPLNLNHRFSSPNKLFDYLGAGLAVVAPSLPVFDEVIGSAGCGGIFSHDGDPSLCSVLEQLASDRSALEALKAKAVAACSSYSWAVQAERLLDVYGRVAGRGVAS